ncbi:hypothetical protein FWK35_00006294 [Aphis craccivora]|uniref:Uncharacterized protein n=1 Tax=Aphis craccivora TaxID=307492 RepID=A0A6G0YQE8_APHCR|nr:hypothetical protein FWK35_00006294 [Aphis craccivora]
MVDLHSNKKQVVVELHLGSKKSIFIKISCI